MGYNAQRKNLKVGPMSPEAVIDFSEKNLKNSPLVDKLSRQEICKKATIAQTQTPRQGLEFIRRLCRESTKYSTTCNLWHQG